VTGPRLAVTFWTRAARQVESAAEWWRENRQDSPEALSDELVRTLDLIARQPGIGLPATNVRLSGVRRILLPRVRARIGNLTIEVTVVAEKDSEKSAAAVFAEIGPWEGETTEEVLAILAEARRDGAQRPVSDL
jgi:plasmid stabilization system protein ParE